MLEIATAIAVEAGCLLRKGQAEAFALESKSTMSDLVTEYDHKSEALIVERLREAFPHHGIVGEEGASFAASSSDGYRWYIDPLDGTNNYAHRIPQFAVSMGLFREDEPILAVIHDPMREQTYFAEKGSGAYKDGKRLRVSQTEVVAKSILASGFPYDKHIDPVNNIEQVGLFLKRCQGFRRMGAAALDLAMVAEGAFDGFWEFKLSSWDVAAGILLISEAGGTVTRIDGSPMGPLTQKINLIASNGHIHQEMLDIVTPSLTERHLFTGTVVK